MRGPLLWPDTMKVKFKRLEANPLEQGNPPTHQVVRVAKEGVSTWGNPPGQRGTDHGLSGRKKVDSLSETSWRG